MTETDFAHLDRRRLIAALGALPFAALLDAAAPARAAGRSEAHASARFDARGASVALIDVGGEIATAPLPDRGHGVSLAPDGKSLVVVARRPGCWAAVFALPDLRLVRRLDLPPGRHFYGHGCFTPDGARFLTTENDTDGGDGLIGVWDVGRGWARIGERRSGGVGPHDLAITADGRGLVVANGGIRTHPDTGRDILDRDSMHPTLALLALDRDEVIATADLGPALRLSSIRHLAVAPDGDVVFGCQFEGAAEAMPPLVGVWRPTRPARPPQLWDMPDAALARLADYVGSVALDATGRIVAATSPRGGATAFFDRTTGAWLGLADLPDVCGVAADGAGFLLTSGAAGIRRSDRIAARTALVDPNPAFAATAWDNHLAALRR